MPALIVSDIRLPHFPGLELLEGLLATAHEIPVILVTGFPSDETYAEAFDLGAERLLEKPFDLDELRLAIRSVLDATPAPLQRRHSEGSWTNSNLARTIGIDAPRILSGADLSKLHDDALRRLAGSTDLFLEMDPNQKVRVLLALKKAGHVVGYLGDGINDASALHAADVGISVEGAVDVAKEAADFVLLEHDLDVLRRGIERGRASFANTLKYVSITTSANFGNMLSMAAASLFLPFLPLLAKPALLVWEETRHEAAWARDLAAFARAVSRARRR